MEEGHDKYHKRFDELKNAAASRFPGLSLYEGCEVMCYKEQMKEVIANINRGIFPTMNGTKYVLMEFDPYNCDGMMEMNRFRSGDRNGNCVTKT